MSKATCVKCGVPVHPDMGDTCDECLFAARAREEAAAHREYLLVSDKNSKVLLSTSNWSEAVKTANMIRRADGVVTIFKATKG